MINSINNRHKKVNSYHKNSSSTASSPNNKAYMIPLVFIISILPYIMRYHEFNAGLSSFKWFAENDKNFDVFLYYKQIFFLITCSVMTMIIIYHIYKNKIKFKIPVPILPLFIYGFLALLSTVFSKYSKFGYKGMFGQFESVFTILGYSLVVYYAYLFIATEENIQYILKFFLYSILGFSIIGVLQATGHNLFATEFGQKLYMPRYLWDDLSNFGFQFGPNRVFLTLYNPNYVGVYVALAAPILIGLLLTEKKMKKILIYVAALAGLIISLIGSQSTAGLLSIFVAIIFVLILFRKYIFRNYKFIIPIIGAGILAIAIFCVFNGNTIKSIIHKITNIQKTEYNLNQIKTGKELIITYKGNDLKINVAKNENNVDLLLTDGNDKNIAKDVDSQTALHTITDKRFAGITVLPMIYNDMLCLQVNIDGKDWNFSNQLGDDTFYYLNIYGKFDKIVKADSALFTGYESLASSRGYIWSRTIPLLKKYIILGSGADTYAMAFPQQDYVGLYNAGMGEETLTKPHSLYLQIGVQSGVLSLIAFLVFYIMYFVSSLKLYWKGTFDNMFSRAGAAILIGTIGYMFASISNDSTITVAPVFWALIGIGIAVNYKVKSMEKINA